MGFIILNGYILYIPTIIYLIMSLLIINKISDVTYLKERLWTFSHLCRLFLLYLWINFCQGNCCVKSLWPSNCDSYGQMAIKEVDKIRVPQEEHALCSSQADGRREYLKWKMSRSVDYPTSLLTQWLSVLSETFKGPASSRVVTPKICPLYRFHNYREKTIEK